MAGSDACPVWLNQVVIGALPNTASRHNSSASPHFLNKLVCSHLPGGDACIVVCRWLYCRLILSLVQIFFSFTPEYCNV